jgi:hypothetical protein
MNKETILTLALKPAMRVTKSVGIGIVLLLSAALIAIITPSAASAAPPCEGPTVTRLVTGLVQGAKGSTIGPDGALYVTEGAAGRIFARRSADRGENDVRQRSAGRDPQHRWFQHRWADRRRVHGQHRVRTSHPRRLLRRRHRR